MEDLDERTQTIAMFAGIALPGLIGKAGLFSTPEDIAKEAFEIGEAMMVELEKRITKQEENESNN